MTAATVIVVPAPACPEWCTETHEQDWDVHGLDADRVCRCELLAARDVDGEPVRLTLTRCAFANPGTVEICATEINVVCLTRLDAENARALAARLIEAASMAEPTVA